MTIAEISRSVQIPYPTATRFVLTLIEIGVIEKTKKRKRYRATALCNSLSCGYKASDRLVEAARPHISELTRITGWPSAVHMCVGNSMVMLHSTHSETTQTFSDYVPGYTLPITECSAGLAYLAYLDPEHRNDILGHLSDYSFKESDSLYSTNWPESYYRNIADAGYATFLKMMHSKDPGKSSSIGVPIKSKDGSAVGSLTLVFFASALHVTHAVNRYLDDIRQVQLAIEEEIAAHNLTVGAHNAA